MIPKVQNGIRVTRFKFDLSALILILSIICDAFREESGEETEAQTLRKIFKTDDLERDFYVTVRNESTIDSFLQDLESYLGQYFEKLIPLTNDMDVLFLFHDEETDRGCMVSLIKDPASLDDPKRIARCINGFFRRNGYVSMFRSYLSGEAYASRYDKLSEHFADEFKKNVVIFDDEIIIPYYPFPFNALRNSTEDTYVKTDFNSFVFNNDYMAEIEHKQRFERRKIYEIISEGKRMGFRINGIVYPLKDRPWLFKDSEKLSTSFKRLCHVYAKQQILKMGDKALGEFVSYAFEPTFCQMISQIKCNYYLPSQCTIDEKYKCLFDTVQLYEKIDDFDGIHIFTNTGEGEHDLGLYTNPKRGKHYHLRHWYKQTVNGNIEHYTSEATPSAERPNVIYALKPRYSYYFMHKYFEDVLKCILTDLDYEFSDNCEYVSPQQDNATICEADFIVKRPDKIIIIEAKTCLSNETLTDTINNKVKVMSEMFGNMFPGVRFEYLLVSQLSSNELGPVDYFINADAKKKLNDYNGMSSYEFEINVNSESGVSLKCISHPDLNRLKELIKKSIG